MMTLPKATNKKVKEIPVSYTHLDVYKRQTHRNTSILIEVPRHTECRVGPTFFRQGNLVICRVEVNDGKIPRLTEPILSLIHI